MTSTSIISAILISIPFIVSCEDNSIIGSDDVAELESADFTITETSYSSSKLTVAGRVSNKGNSTYYPPWHIEAEFYSDSTFTTKFGGSSERVNYALAPGENTLWKLTYSSDLIVESDYPNFAIKNLRAYTNR
jgi:hypothetical protein